VAGDDGGSLRERLNHPDIAIDVLHLAEDVDHDLARLPPSLRRSVSSRNPADSLLTTDWEFALACIPAWLAVGVDLMPDLRRRLVVGGYYMCQYTLGVDALVDALPFGEQPAALPHDSVNRPASLAGSMGLAHWLATRHFQAVFGPDSPFWSHFEAAHHDWATALVWERPLTSYNTPFMEALRQESNKCALGRIASAGVMIAVRESQRVAEVETAYHTMSAAMNLIDDFADWVPDLRARRHNSFVALAATRGFLEQIPPNSDSLARALARPGLLTEYTRTVAELLEQTWDYVTPFNAPLWLTFLESLRDLAEETAAAFARDVELLRGTLWPGLGGSQPVGTPVRH
jgi:hypothetical protein